MARHPHRLLVASLATFTSMAAWAQPGSGPAPGYPDKAIRMIVPVTAGGSTDVVACLRSQLKSRGEVIRRWGMRGED